MTNPYEACEQKLIPSVLIYAENPHGEILMLHRNQRGENHDYHAGKWNGLGGKMEKQESLQEASRREFEEEAGVALNPDLFHPLGILHFPSFKPHKHEDWITYVLYVHFPADIEVPLDVIREGELKWIPKEEMKSLPLWEGDYTFLPYVLEKRPFVGTFWYDENKKLVDSKIVEFIKPT